jgi:hypothetical protein
VKSPVAPDVGVGVGVEVFVGVFVGVSVFVGVGVGVGVSVSVGVGVNTSVSVGVLVGVGVTVTGVPVGVGDGDGKLSYDVQYPLLFNHVFASSPFANDWFAIVSDKVINDPSVKSSDLKNPTEAVTPDNGVG